MALPRGSSFLAKGKLNDLAIKKTTNETVVFWTQKFQDSSLDISNIDFDFFIKNIDFIKVSESYLIKDCISNLLKKHNINLGTENQYLKALFYSSFNWSKERTSVKFSDLKIIFQSVTDSFSKSPTNPAIEYNWIKAVNFENTELEEKSEYFDGKAARPIHIIQNLPVRREEWETKILNNVLDFSTTIIRSSSGQGKSTLAWLTSLKLKLKGFTIYELNYCKEKNNVAGLFDFIKSRVLIGKFPIIVIDGLNNIVSEYQELIYLTANLPVKFLITTRQIDWYRYGLDLSKTSAQITDISLSINEAKKIFSELKKRNKLHHSVIDWQSNWEAIGAKGLLIEYVYLLTKGEMISNRLNQQIKELNLEKDSNTKLEILRLIAIADILNLKIKSIQLINYVQENIGFVTDRGEVLKQLEKEYYLRFDDEFIEGLHPVRSQHLVNILNDYVPISDTLLSLYKILTEDFIYDYFISIPFNIKIEEKEDFYEQLAKLVSKQKFSEMVFAIDGLMHSEPLKYWEENKVIFDEVFEHGGLEIFVGDTLPFTKLDTLGSLGETLGDKYPNLIFFRDKIKELTKYDIKDSDVVMFAKSLSNQIEIHKQNINSYEGLGFLIKWLKQLSVEIPSTIEFNDNELIQVLEKGNINEVSELFSYFHLSNSKRYKKFTSKYKNSIIGILKRETNTLTISENRKNVHIEYLLDKNADKANDYSVYRIQTVYNLLPFYEKYCTKAIILPFPNEEMYEIIIQNSIKAMPKENIVDTFDVHINQIWNNTILNNYRSTSSYEWQNQYKVIREESLIFTKLCVRYFEATMEGNPSKFKSSLNRLIDQITKLTTLLIQRKSYPRQSIKYFDKAKFIEEENAINDWCFSLNNTLNQLGDIIKPKELHDRNRAFLNLKAVIFKLPLMQKSFQKVLELSFTYFNTTTLKLDEQVWYGRLLSTVTFYIESFINSQRSKVFNSKTTISNWWEFRNKKRLEEIHKILNDFDMESNFKFYLPNKIIVGETINEIVIGISGMDLENFEDDLFYLIEGLIDFTSIDIDFFNFININNSEAIGGGFRVQKAFFERFKNFIEVGEFEESNYGNPIPIIPDETLLESLDGIFLKKVTVNEKAEAFTNMMFCVWKLSEYRNRLNKKNDIENRWLEENEKEFKLKIENHLSQVEITSDFKDYIEEFVENKLSINNEIIVNHLNDHLVSLN